MSHIVEIKTQIKDEAAVRAACARLRLAAPAQRTVRLFSATATGLAVELPQWRYPLVCDLASGALRYDNFDGLWGNPAELHRFLQSYGVEKAKLEARRQGHTTTETTLADGSIRLAIHVGGAVAGGVA